MFYPAALKRVLDQKSTYLDLFTAYLDVFTTIRRNLIHPESAILLLDSETDPAVLSHAIQALIEREHPAAVERMLMRINNGLLSEEDAKYLLALKPRYSFRELEAAPGSLIRDRLLAWLVHAHHLELEGILTRGCWIRCDAGIGQVTNIRRAVTEQELIYALIKAEDILLTVILRPGEKEEHIQIDLSKRQIFFPGAATIYYCARDRCRGFISTEQRVVTNTHNHAAHDGIRASFGPTANPIAMQSGIELLNPRPENLYA
jgi:hypothetical protein